jgi:hypothetical protein
MLLDLDWRGEGAIEVSEMRKHEVVTIREMSSLFCSNKLIPSAAQIIIIMVWSNELGAGS